MKSNVTKQKNGHLAVKISRLLLFILLLIFTVLIVISFVFTRNAVLTATYNELYSNSKANGCQIQEFMNVCQSTAKNLNAKIEDTFSVSSSKNPVTSNNTGEYSVVYPELILNENQKDLENYLIFTAKNAVRNNDAIIGIGIMFEPYQFTNSRESYALYFTNEGSDIGVSDVGAYSEFSVNEYYQIAVGKTDTVFVKPYIYRDMWMITGATPIWANGKQIGVINVDISMDEFNKLSLTNENYPSMNVILSSGDGTISFDSSDTEHIGKNLKDEVISDSGQANEIIALLSSETQFFNKYKNRNGIQTVGFFYPLSAGSETWQTITNVSVHDIESASLYTAAILVLFCVLSLIIIIGVIWYTLSKSLKPIQGIADAATEISRGKLNINLKSNASNDEIGILTESFQIISDTLINLINDENYLLNEMAEGNFNVESTAVNNYIGDFAPLLKTINNINFKLSDTLSKINQAADHVASASNQVSGGAQSLSQGASQQASAVDTLAKNISEISEQVQQTADGAKIVSNQTSDAGKTMFQANNQMQELKNAIEEISISSNEISKIIKTIEDIAFQTNILALNASVEAARAGEFGKGFSVVADEVRNLASKSQEASKNTAVLIERSLRAVEHGTKMTDATVNIMAEVVASSEQVQDAVKDIANTAQHQAAFISEISDSITQISSGIQTTSATAQESAATSEELSSQSHLLKNLVSKFRLRK